MKTGFLAATLAATTAIGLPFLPTRQPVEERIQAYVTEHNQEVISYDGGTVKRRVSRSLRESILRRDRRKCVICRSSDELEVDHARALMNGGDNESDNLFTLCDPCHTIKTREDFKLKAVRLRYSRSGKTSHDGSPTVAVSRQR